MGRSSVVFQVLLALHVTSAVVGFGSIAVTGCYAGLGRPRRGRPVPAPVRRFFRPGPNVASRVVLVVPLLGLALALSGPSGDLAAPWLWASSGLWAGATALAAGVLWPAESRVQKLLAERPERAGQDARARDELARASGRASRSAAAISLAGAAAFVLMVSRPGG